MHGEFHSFSVMSWTKPFKLRPDAASDTSRRNNRRVAMQRKLRRDAFSATSCLYQVSLSPSIHCRIHSFADVLISLNVIKHNKIRQNYMIMYSAAFCLFGFWTLEKTLFSINHA